MTKTHAEWEKSPFHRKSTMIRIIDMFNDWTEDRGQMKEVLEGEQMHALRERKMAEKAEVEVASWKASCEQETVRGMRWKGQAEKAEATNAKLVDFVNEVKISADRGCLRAKAEKLIIELEEK